MAGSNSMMSIEKLTGRDNWASWSFAVKAYLQHEELYNCILDVPNVEDPKSVKQDTRTKSKLILLVDPILYVHSLQKQKIKNEIAKDSYNEVKEKKTVYLPVCVEPEKSVEGNINDDESHETCSTGDSDSDQFVDINDETYLPDITIESPPISNITLRPRRYRNNDNYNDVHQSPSSLICQNVEASINLLNSDPQSLQEALSSEKADEWKRAMEEEYQSLIKNNTWTQVTLLEGKSVIPSKWVYKTKTDSHGSITRYKARLVIKGYKQVKGIDYNEVYAPVVRYTSIRYLIGLAAKCMISNAELQVTFWAEAVATATYIINRSPTSSLSDATPHEVWTKKRPNLSHMRIFGCPAMVHIPKEKRTKLDVKSRKLIFVGCLLYLSQGTRPDITYIVNSLSRFNNEPTNEHWMALKRVLRYLKATMCMKMVYKMNVDGNITGYCDSDWGNDIEDRRSCTGYIFLFQGAAVSWNSKKQLTIALSTTEAEYMSLASAIQEALWLKQLADEFQPELKDIPITLYCDNQSAISLSGHAVYHARSKHIDIRYHFVREKIAAKQVTVKYRCTADMVADVLTKGLPRPKHENFTKLMGLKRLRPGEDVESMDACADIKSNIHSL